MKTKNNIKLLKAQANLALTTILNKELKSCIELYIHGLEKEKEELILTLMLAKREMEKEKTK